MPKIIFDSTSIMAKPYHVEINILPEWEKYWEKKGDSAPIYQSIAKEIINQPYTDEPTDFLKHGELIIYHTNHDASHGARQLINTQFFLNMVRKYGLPDYQNAAKSLACEEVEILKLAGFVLRAARTNEMAGMEDPSNQERSAQLFQELAKALGFNESLIESMTFCVQYTYQETQEVYKKGFQGDESMQLTKLNLVKHLLNLSHHTDLVRCFNDLERINKPNLAHLTDLIIPEKVEKAATCSLDFARASCDLTGTAYFMHDEKNTRLYPSLHLKAKTTLRVGETLNTLNILGQEFLKAVDHESLVSADLLIQTQQRHDTQEIDAANTIKRAYFANRAHQIAEKATGVNLASRSKVNLERLVNELISGYGLSKEEAQKKTKDDALTSEELVIYNYLVHEFDWTLKHITLDYSSIYYDGNTLKSLRQRNREARFIDNSHSNDFEGRTDNVYFSVGSPDALPATFLQLARGKEIRIPLRSFLSNTPLNKNTPVNENTPGDKLAGFWLSSPSYFFLKETTLKSNMGSTKRQINYKKDKSSFSLDKCQKHYYYQRENGEIFERTLSAFDEAVVGKEVLPYLAYHVILELRLIGGELRNKCLQDRKALSALVDAIYQAENFESYIPSRLNLEDPRIKILPFNQDEIKKEQYDRILAALNSYDVGGLQALLREGLSPNTILENGQTLVMYLIIKGYVRHLYLAKYLIENGANLNTSFGENSLLAHAIAGHHYEIVDLILQTGNIDKREPLVKRLININDDPKTISIAVKEQDKTMLNLLLKHGLDYSYCCTEILITIANLPETIALTVLQEITEAGFNKFTLEDEESKTHYYDALQTVIFQNKQQLLAAFLNHGVNPNVKIADKPNLLTYALKIKENKSVELLQASGAVENEKIATKAYLHHFIIMNASSEYLVGKQVFNNGITLPYWEFPLYHIENDSKDHIANHLFSITGIQFKLTDFEVEIANEEGEEPLLIVSLNDKSPLKLIATNKMPQCQWVSKTKKKTLSLGPLVSAYLDGKEISQINNLFKNKTNLLEAIKQSNITLVKSYLKEGISAVDPFFLIYAIDNLKVDLSIIQLLISQGCLVNFFYRIGDEEFTPLHLAILHRNYELVECLINARANVNQALSKTKVTPLMLAAEHDQFEIVQLLERKGAYYSHPNNRAILAYVCGKQCSDKMFDYLLQRANKDDAFFGYVPVIITALKKDKYRLEALLQKGANLNVKDPRNGKAPEDFFPFKERGLFDKYKSKPDIEYCDWNSLADEASSFLKLTNKINLPNLEELIAREYELSFIDEANTQFHGFFQQLLQEAGLDPRHGKVKIAIAHAGDLPVFTCAGFSDPVIAIHKDYLLQNNDSYQGLRFAIAHQLAFIENASEKQFTVLNAAQRIQLDTTAKNRGQNSNLLVEHLQHAAEFYKEHHSQTNFEWPQSCYRGDGYFSSQKYYFGERIKAMHLSLAQSSTQIEEAILIPPMIKEEVANLKQEIHFKDFPNDKEIKDMYAYLLEQLPCLSDELLPFELTGIPSTRLKEFVNLLQSLPLQGFEDCLNLLLEKAHDLKLPCFSYLYKAAACCSFWLNSHHSTQRLPPAGYFARMWGAMNGFLKAQSFEEANKEAEKILKLYPLLKNHCENTTNVSYEIRSYGSQNGETLPKERYFGSDIGKMINWPQFSHSPQEYLEHTNWACQQGDGFIWRAMWIMGVVNNPSLYPLIPKEALKKLPQLDLISLGKEDKIIPLPLLKTPKIYPKHLTKIIYSYFAKMDNTRLSEDFITEYRVYVEANRCDLSTFSFSDTHNREAVRELLKQLSNLAQGNATEQAFVRDFFLKDPCQLFSIPLSNDSLYVKFLLEHWQLFESHSFYPLMDKMTDVSYIPVDIWMKVLKLKDTKSAYWGNLLIAIRWLINRHGTLAVASKLLRKYLENDITFPIFSIDSYEFITFSHQLAHGRLLSKLTDKIQWQELEDCQLNPSQCVSLYRILDVHLLFPTVDYRHKLGTHLLEQIKACLDSETRYELLNILMSVDGNNPIPLNDRELFDQAADCWVDAIEELLGKDDGSYLFYHRIKKLLDQSYQSFTNRDVVYLFDRLAQKLNLQYQVSNYMGCLIEPELHENYTHNRTIGFSLLAQAFSFLGKNKNDKIKMLEFISSPLTRDSRDSFSNYLNQHSQKNEFLKLLGYTDNVTPDKKSIEFILMPIHQQFWHLKLPERAVVLDSLIITLEEEMRKNSHLGAYQEGFNFAANKLFPNADANPEEQFALAILKAYLKTADENERQFLLAGIIVAANESERKVLTIGRKFALLCENLGPAFVKVAQAIQSHPDTSPEIKKDLAGVKSRANPPPLWVIWRLIKKALPASEFNNIAHLGKLLGSASYNLALEEETKEGSKQVLLLLRENAQKDAEKGFAHLRRTIEACEHSTMVKSRDSFLTMIDEAQRMSSAELDYEIGDLQHVLANKVYQNTRITVKVNESEYVVSFEPCKSLKSGPGYRHLTLMKGIEFNELPDKSNEDKIIRKAIALAVMEKELSLILSGNAFDCDRHGNQLRVEIEGNHIKLGLFDFGEMSLNPLTDKEIDSAARLLEELPQALKNGGSIDALFLKHIQLATRAGKSGHHLMHMNKALLALQDFQKELSNEDVKNILVKINPKIHPQFAKALTKGAYQQMSYWEVGSTFFKKGILNTIDEAVQRVMMDILRL